MVLEILSIDGINRFAYAAFLVDSGDDDTNLQNRSLQNGV